MTTTRARLVMHEAEAAALRATTRPTAAAEYGVALGVALVLRDAAVVFGLAEYAAMYRGEALRAFAEGMRAGRRVAHALVTSAAVPEQRDTAVEA